MVIKLEKRNSGSQESVLMPVPEFWNVRFVSYGFHQLIFFFWIVLIMDFDSCIELPLDTHCVLHSTKFQWLNAVNICESSDFKLI